jgi:hypothetical protein
MTFNPNEHLMQIKNKNGSADYLQVCWRLVWFRQECPQGTIESEMVLLDLDRETEEESYAWNNEARRSEKVTKRASGIAIFKAIVTDGKGGKAEAYKCEKAASFGDYIEKANTGAVGRALAMLGFGTQFTGDELNEEHRIVDAPVDRAPAADTTPNNGTGKSASGNAQLDQAPPSAQQLDSLKKLAVHLGEKIARPKTYAEAKKQIDEMQAEYDAMVARGRAS